MEDYFKEVKVGDKTYVLETCTFVQQWWILKLFAKCSLSDVLRTMVIAHDNPEISKGLAVATLFGQLAAKATNEEVDLVSEYLLHSVYIKGEKTPIELSDFRNNMKLYSELLLKALEANFSDFSEFLNFQSVASQEQ